MHIILAERKGYAFYVDIEYENLPDFCTHCQCTVHYVEICKRLLNKDKQVAHKDQNKEADGDVNNKAHKEQRRTGIEWRVVAKKPEIVNLEASTSK